jgi:hypothetical protein
MKEAVHEIKRQAVPPPERRANATFFGAGAPTRTSMFEDIGTARRGAIVFLGWYRFVERAPTAVMGGGPLSRHRLFSRCINSQTRCFRPHARRPAGPEISAGKAIRYSIA